MVGKRLRVRAGRATAAAAVVVAAVVLAACNSGAKRVTTTTAPTTVAEATTSTVTATTAPVTTLRGGGVTTTRPATATTGVAPASVRQRTPEDAAKHLFAAWVAGDRNTALKSADRQAVDVLFASRSKPGPPLPEFYGCEPGSEPAAAATCSYRYEGGGIIMTAAGTAANGYIIAKTAFIAD